MYSLYRYFIPALIVASTLPAHAGSCDVLPSDAKVIMQQKFPGLRPKNLSDLSEDDRKLWLRAHPKACPGIASGHFEEAGRVAYAILLVPKTGNAGMCRIVVFSKETDGYAVRLLEEATCSGDSGLVISKEVPGTYSEFEDGKSVHLKLDSVNVEWLEKSSVLYYRSHGKYRSMQTSD